MEIKNVFDWLREQISDTAYCEDEGTCNYCQRTWCPLGLVDRDDLDKIIDEAEAKWEAECCEWERFKHFELIIAPHDKTITLQTFDLKDYPYCPICGKPIKIREVE